MRQNRSYHFIDQKKLKHVQYIMKYNWSLIVNEKGWLKMLRPTYLLQLMNILSLFNVQK